MTLPDRFSQIRKSHDDIIEDLSVLHGLADERTRQHIALLHKQVEAHRCLALLEELLDADKNKRTNGKNAYNK